MWNKSADNIQSLDDHKFGTEGDVIAPTGMKNKSKFNSKGSKLQRNYYLRS